MGARALHDDLLQVGNLSEKILKRIKLITCISDLLATLRFMSQDSHLPYVHLPPSSSSLAAHHAYVLQNLVRTPLLTTTPALSYMMPPRLSGLVPTLVLSQNPNVAMLPNDHALIRRISPVSEAQQRAPKFGQGSFRMLPYHTVFKDDPTRIRLTIGAPSTMNKVIFDYLITQGYPGAASRFAKEAGIPEPQAETALDRIEERKEIKLAILRGEIESAIHQINDYDARVCAAIDLLSPYSMLQ